MSKKNYEDNLYYQRILQRYKLLALNMFTWEGLPNNLKGRHIEKALYSWGQCVAFNHEDYGIMILPCSASGTVNAFWEPTQVIVNQHDVNKTINIKNGEGIWLINNDEFEPTEYDIMIYAKKMFEVQKSIDLNIRQQRYPFFIEGTKDSKYSIEQAMRKSQSGEPYVVVNKELGLTTGSNTKVHTLMVPYVADKLSKYEYDLDRKVLSFVGLNNAFEKKERMLVDEINSNNDFIDRNVEIMFKCRKEFCEEFNAMYHTNITVKKNNDIFEFISKDSDNIEMEE